MTETWDGYPENRERDGWHWLEITSPDDIALVAGLWESGEWSLPMIGQDQTPEEMSKFGGAIRYVGPCLTPAEVEARVAEAHRKALEDAAKTAEAEPEFPGRAPLVMWVAPTALTARSICRATKRNIAAAIRALKGAGQ